MLSHPRARERSGPPPFRAELLNVERLEERARSLATEHRLLPRRRSGSAGWMHRVGLEEILGLRLGEGTLEVSPCIPASWPGFTAEWRVGRSTSYVIEIRNPERRGRGVSHARCDGQPVDPRRIPLVDDGATHRVEVLLGQAP